MPEIGGFKTLDEGHVDVWRSFQRRYPDLRHHEYEAFPRGRVNWRAGDNAWLLLLDPKLNEDHFTPVVINAWNLPRTRLLIMTDAHYRSRQRVGPPLAGS